MEKNNSLINDEVGLKGYALDFTLAKNHLADETAVADAVKKHLANLEKELLEIANIEKVLKLSKNKVEIKMENLLSRHYNMDNLDQDDFDHWTEEPTGNLQ